MNVHSLIHARRRRLARAAIGQRGFTLIELMVALSLGILVTGATVAALLAARRGFTTVDDAGQLRENARFSVDIIERIAVQAGFEDIAMGQFASNIETGFVGISGFDNALLALPGAPAAPGMATDSRNTNCTATDTSCVNGSDILVLRYQGTSTIPGGTTPDGSMINCSGAAEGEKAGLTPSTSIFHVLRSSTGEPTLACTYLAADGVTWTTVALVQGVEAFQVLYGTDNVLPNQAPAGPCKAFGALATEDSVPDRWLTARQMVAPTTAGTEQNWRRVRSLRIGMLLRGDSNKVQSRDVAQTQWDVFGPDNFTAADVLSRLTVVKDGRLRQNLVFEIHLRNPQTQCLS